MLKVTFSALLSAALVFLAIGCSKLTTAQVKSITGVTVGLGFTAWAAENKDQEAKVAAQVAKGADEALSILKDNPTFAADALNIAIHAKLTNGLPPAIQGVIQSAAGILDSVLPEPAVGSVMNADQLNYLLAFVQGVKDGLGGIKDIPDPKTVKTAKSLKPGKWLTNKK